MATETKKTKKKTTRKTKTETVTTTASVDSRAIIRADLPVAQSRVEEYLDYLCGRATVLADLPKPKSRVEEFLEYLCYNGLPGGGGQPLDPRTIIDADLVDDVLRFTQLDGNVIPIPLDYVKEWEDLSDVHRLTDINLFNPLTVVYDERYGTNGNIEKADGWVRITVDVEGGNDYTVIKNAHDSQTYVYLDSDENLLQRVPNNGSDSNGRKKYWLSIPQQVNTTPVVKLGFNVHPNNKDTIEDIMVLKGRVEAPNQTIPFTNGADVIVDGSKVSVAFDNRNTNLVSQTVAGAINEINNKVDSIGTTSIKTINSITPNTNGNIEVSMTNNVDNISFAVGGVEYGKLDYMTQVDVDEIKAIFV